jgi:hypothetical protein
MTMKITVFKTLVLSGVLAASSGGFSSNEVVLKQEEYERYQKELRDTSSYLCYRQYRLMTNKFVL